MANKFTKLELGGDGLSIILTAEVASGPVVVFDATALHVADAHAGAVTVDAEVLASGKVRVFWTTPTQSLGDTWNFNFIGSEEAILDAAQGEIEDYNKDFTRRDGTTCIKASSLINEEATDLGATVLPIFLNRNNFNFASCDSDGRGLKCSVSGTERPLYVRRWDATNRIATVLAHFEAVPKGTTSIIVGSGGTLSSSADNTLNQFPSGDHVLAQFPFSEGTGTTFASTGGTYSGTLSNSAIWQNGDGGGIGIGARSSPFSTGKYLKFNGTTHYAYILNPPMSLIRKIDGTYHSAESFAYSFWMRPEAANTSAAYILSYNRFGIAATYVAFGSNGTITCNMDTGYANLSANATLSPGFLPITANVSDRIWHRVYVGFDPTNGLTFEVGGIRASVVTGSAGALYVRPRSLTRDTDCLVSLGARVGWSAGSHNPDAGSYAAVSIAGLTFYGRNLEPHERDQELWRMPVHPIKCPRNKISNPRIVIAPDIYGAPDSTYTDHEEFSRTNIKVGGKWYGFYRTSNTGGDGTRHQIIRVESTDGYVWTNPVACFGYGVSGGIETTGVLTGPEGFIDTDYTPHRVWLYYSVGFSTLKLTYTDVDHIAGANAAAMNWATAAVVTFSGMGSPVNVQIQRKTGGTFYVYGGCDGVAADNNATGAFSSTPYGYFYAETADLAALGAVTRITNFPENNGASGSVILDADGETYTHFGHNVEGDYGPKSRAGIGIGGKDWANGDGPYGHLAWVDGILSPHTGGNIEQIADLNPHEDALSTGSTRTIAYATCRNPTVSAIIAYEFPGSAKELATTSVRVEVDVDTSTTGAGLGGTPIDHNTGGTDTYQIVHNDTTPLSGAILKAYLTTDYIAGSRTASTLQATQSTGDDGRWLGPMMLVAGLQYTVAVEHEGYVAQTFTLTVAE